MQCSWIMPLKLNLLTDFTAAEQLFHCSEPGM